MTLKRLGPASINSFKLLVFAVIAVGIAVIAYYGSTSTDVESHNRDAREERHRSAVPPF